MEEKDFVERDDRLCPNCRKPIVGRSDKTFCCDSCRSEFNNRKSRTKLKYVNEIDRILRKNRSIIDNLYSEGHTSIEFSALHNLGFNFHYITSLKEGPSSSDPCIIGCFDYCYSILEDGTVSLYKKAIPL